MTQSTPARPQELAPADLDQVAAAGAPSLSEIIVTKPMDSTRSDDAAVDLADLNNVRNNFGARI